MNSLNLLAYPPHSMGEPLSCAQVWSTLNPYQREIVHQVMLLVCCQLASLSRCNAANKAETPLASSDAEVTYERA